MASLWIQTRSCKAPTKMLGGLLLTEAQKHLQAMLRRYLREKPGRTVRMVSGLDAVLVSSRGQVWANVYVEPVSPPTQPEPGDTRRTATQGGA